MQASTLIRRALRLINVPGRGASLSSEDEANAFETFQELLDGDSVARSLQGGIRRHFFELTSDHIYTYGPGGTLDTDNFEDPVPMKVEDAYIRAGSTIVRNELLVSELFNSATGWTIGANWSIVNGVAEGAGVTSTSISQVIANTIGETYKVKLTNVILSAGTLSLTVGGDLSQVISASGDYEFQYTATGATPTFTITGAASFAGTIDAVSVRDVLKAEKYDLEGNGSDYTVDIMDQRTYNRRFSKGTGGRPYRLLFSRGHPLAEIRFDNAPATGDKIVLDVQVNRLKLARATDQVRVHDEVLKYFRYQLAHEMAPEYGKQLSPSADRTRRRARRLAKAAGSRVNNLRVDGGLLNRRAFDINRGDP